MDDPNADTEWNDILRQHGVLPPKPEPERSPSPPPPPSLAKRLDRLQTTEEIDDLLLEADDSDTERQIARFREQRMAEMRKEEKKGRFGSIIPIGREDYTREVADASLANDEDEDEDAKEGSGRGTGVVCFLYKQGSHPPSVRLALQLRTLASRYPRTKFTSIVGDKCIANYPDSMLPTLILYRKGNIVEQLVSWGVKTEGTLEELEAVLLNDKILDIPRVPIQRDAPRARRDSDVDSEEERAQKGKKSGIRQSFRRRADSDSDFDL